MDIKGMYIFNSESGVTLFSKRMLDVQEDLFTAFISAIRGFFKSLSLGGLSSFSTEYYTFYLANFKCVSATLIVDVKDKTDKYYNVSYDICKEFYSRYHLCIESPTFLYVPDVDNFSSCISEIIERNKKLVEKRQELIQLFKLSKSGELEEFEYINEQQLYDEELFIAINNITRKIYIVENAQYDIPGRLLYMANKEVKSLNQSNYRSECSINNVTDIWDLERIVGVIDNLLTGATIEI